MRRILILLPALLALQVGVSPALAWTWPVDGPVLQTFDVGSDPYEGGRHRGIDVGAPTGATVVAPASGTVSFAGTLPTYGHSVTIETPDGYSVTLVHLGASSVAEGAAIEEGDQVGVVGPSGEMELAEPYVHLGIRHTSDPNGYVDPLLLLPARSPGPADGGAGADGTGGSDQAQDGTAVADAGGSEAAGVESPASTTTLEPPDVPAPEPPAPAEPLAAATAPAGGAQDSLPAPATSSSTIGVSDASLGVVPVTAPLPPVDGTPTVKHREPPRPETPPRQVRPKRRATSVPDARPAARPSSVERGRPVEHAAPAGRPPQVVQASAGQPLPARKPPRVEHAASAAQPTRAAQSPRLVHEAPAAQPLPAGQSPRVEHAAPPAQSTRAAQPAPVEHVTRVERPRERSTPADHVAPARPLQAPARRSKRGLPPAATQPSRGTDAAAPATAAPSSSVLVRRVPRRLAQPPARHAGSRVSVRPARPEGHRAHSHATRGSRLQEPEARAERPGRVARSPRPDTPQAQMPAAAPAAARTTRSGTGLSPWLAGLLGAGSAMLVLLCFRRRHRGGRVAALGEPPPSGQQQPDPSRKRADDRVADALDRELARILAHADASRRSWNADRRTVDARGASRSEPQRE